MDKYKNFEELKKNESAEDYFICCEERSLKLTVIAPHGGGIEPGTSEIARGIAGNEYSLYTFDGLKKNNNKNLHITSTNFDEPIGRGIVKRSETVIAKHGCEGNTEFLELGGLDTNLQDNIQLQLVKAGFRIAEPPIYRKAKDPNNICNRGKNKSGVQIEISKKLRDDMFKSNTKEGRLHITQSYENFVSAIRLAISEAAERKNKMIL